MHRVEGRQTCGCHATCLHSTIIWAIPPVLMLERVFAVKLLTTDTDLQGLLGEARRVLRSMFTDHGICLEENVIPETWHAHVTAFFVGLPVLT